MKKFLIGIFSIVLGFVGFSSAGSYTYPGESFSYVDNYSYTLIAYYGAPSIVKGGMPSREISCDFENLSYTGPGIISVLTFFYDYGVQNTQTNSFYAPGIVGCGLFTSDAGTYNISFDSLTISGETIIESSGGGGTPEDITVYYNNGNSSESVTCDGTQAIEINGLSTITSTNTFTPYFNISYKDEDNQSLVESYSKSNLYLSGGLFKKTYTGDNERILTDTIDSPNSTFTGYVPVFEVTGSTQPIDTDYNMFNNFTDNSLKVLLSNIPGYIQYVFIIGIILFLLGIVKMFKRRK